MRRVAIFSVLLAACTSPDTEILGLHQKRLLYAAFDDGSVHVYDIDDGHREIDSYPTFQGVIETRGACAIAQTGMLYLAHLRDGGGFIDAVDIMRRSVVWTHRYEPSVDRLSCSHDGTKVWLPTNEGFTDDTLLVIDAKSGDLVTKVHVSPRPHDALESLDGERVYLETKTSNVVTKIDGASSVVVGRIGPFADILGPFTFDAHETRLYANVFGVNGFQVADMTAGAVMATASIPEEGAAPGTLNQHGLALSPDETEVWVNDGLGKKQLVHVFDVTVTPPLWKRAVEIDFQDPHWVTFSIAGDFAYVAGPKLGGRGLNVIDAKSYVHVVTLGPSEDVFEVDLDHGAVSRVGNQYGVGRRF
jgi:DNA-binding beta-propeller fold protein YncE